MLCQVSNRETFNRVKIKSYETVNIFVSIFMGGFKGHI